MLRSLTLEDSGLYECQATTYPPQYIIIKLIVQGIFILYTNTYFKYGASQHRLPEGFFSSIHTSVTPAAWAASIGLFDLASWSFYYLKKSQKSRIATTFCFAH